MFYPSAIVQNKHWFSAIFTTPHKKNKDIVKHTSVSPGLLLHHSSHAKHSAVQRNCLNQNDNSFATGSLDCIWEPGPFTACFCQDTS